MANGKKDETEEAIAFARSMEQQAYDAYSEWPLFLVKRRSELLARLAPSKEAASAAPAASSDKIVMEKPS